MEVIDEEAPLLETKGRDESRSRKLLALYTVALMITAAVASVNVVSRERRAIMLVVKEEMKDITISSSSDLSLLPVEGEVCLVHVAAGDEFEQVSAFTLPSKLVYAEAHGYSVLHYADEPTCCDGVNSYACSLGNVRYKYCALRDALTTGGAASTTGAVQSGSCSWVFITDGDALFTPNGPALDTLVPEGALESSAVTAVISVVKDHGVLTVTDQMTEPDLYTQFNSGAMLWRNSEEALSTVASVLDFDDASYNGATSCDCGTVGGCGDQWALCGAAAKDPGVLDGFVALSHPAAMQRCLLYNNGEVVLNTLMDWPPADEEAAFVINCAGNDPLGCATLMHKIYYPDNADIIAVDEKARR